MAENKVENKYIKPFTMEFVLSKTMLYMRNQIDVSIRRTFERLSDFNDDSNKSKEVFKTLAILHGLRKQIDDLQNKYIKGE